MRSDNSYRSLGRLWLAITAGVGANVWLGGSALYWRALGEVSPLQLVALRIFLSLAVLTIVMAATRNLGSLYQDLTFKHLGTHGVAALLLVINWGVFIWASIQGYVLEAGLGYLIAPCITIVAGVWILGERLRRSQAVIAALIGVALMLLIAFAQNIRHDVLLAIATTWGGYVCLKKASPLGAISGTSMETFLLSLLLMCILLLAPWEAALPETLLYEDRVLVMFAGLVSVIPLVLLAYAAKHLPMTTMAALQFLLPTTQFVLAMVVYQQSIGIGVAVAVIWIWMLLAAPLVIDYLDRYRRTRNDLSL
jgi:chloramphenicol-sensitive protein RarD